MGGAEPAASYEPLTVMGGAAQFGEIEDGYLVTFLAADSPCHHDEGVSLVVRQPGARTLK